jgi:hypothetical protein
MDEEQSESESAGTDEGSKWMGIDSKDESSKWLGIRDEDNATGLEGNSLEDLMNMVGGEDEDEFNEEVVEAPKHNDPFQNDQTHHLFEVALARLDENGRVPLGYGIHHSEWDDNGYPAVGTKRSGQKGGKRLEVALPDSVWRPRSVRWVQGLYLMDQLRDRLSQ